MTWVTEGIGCLVIALVAGLFLHLLWNRTDPGLRRRERDLVMSAFFIGAAFGTILAIASARLGLEHGNYCKALAEHCP